MITDYALAFLREHAQQHAGTPFFAYVAYTSPHFPLHALPQDIAKYRDKYLQGWDSARQARWERMKSMGLISCELSALERDVGPPYAFPDAIEKLGLGEINRPLPWSELTDAQRRGMHAIDTGKRSRQRVWQCQATIVVAVPVEPDRSPRASHDPARKVH